MVQFFWPSLYNDDCHVLLSYDELKYMDADGMWALYRATCQCCYRTVRTWDVREPVVSQTYRRLIASSSASDRTDVDTEVDADIRPIHKSLTGLLRKVIWPVSNVSTFCCASDECYS